METVGVELVRRNFNARRGWQIECQGMSPFAKRMNEWRQSEHRPRDQVSLTGQSTSGKFERKLCSCAVIE